MSEQGWKKLEVVLSIVAFLVLALVWRWLVVDVAPFWMVEYFMLYVAPFIVIAGVWVVYKDRRARRANPPSED